MKGRGREMIQFGVPIADAPPDGENMTGASKGMSCDFFLIPIYSCLPTFIVCSHDICLLPPL